MSMVPEPFFSVLLPSRNRLELLRLAVDTVLRQDFEDFEVVVADNASAEDYAGYVDSLKDGRVRLVRSDASLHVTENWNRALEASRGSYVIMLGDDDGLTPGSLSRARRLIQQFDEPESLFSMAYQYVYPNTVPAKPHGYLVSIHYDAMGPSNNNAFLLDVRRARLFGREALRLHHLFGFNSQYFVWRRDYISRLKPFGSFFQSPYPDFYSSFMTMLTAERIVVDPTPGTIIGVSPKSFGFYFNNKQFDRGNAMLMLNEAAAETVRGASGEIDAALALPGSQHLRNWFIAALFVQRSLANISDYPVDVVRYRRVQIYSALYGLVFDKNEGRRLFDRMRPMLQPDERQIAAAILRNLRKFSKSPSRVLKNAPISLEDVMRVHTRPRFLTHDIGSCRNITDVWTMLAASEGRGRPHWQGNGGWRRAFRFLPRLSRRLRGSVREVLRNP